MEVKKGSCEASYKCYYTYVVMFRGHGSTVRGPVLIAIVAVQEVREVCTDGADGRGRDNHVGEASWNPVAW